MSEKIQSGAIPQKEIEHVHEILSVGEEFAYCKCGARLQQHVRRGGLWIPVENSAWWSKEEFEKRKIEEQRRPMLMLREREKGYEILECKDGGEWTVFRMVTWKEGGRERAQELYNELMETDQYRPFTRSGGSSELFSGFTPTDRD